MTASTTILLLAACFGVAIILICYWVYSISVVIPKDERKYMDKPPLGFRLIWPFIRAAVYYFGSYLSVSSRIKTLAKLKKAGVDYSLSPEQFLLSKWVVMLVGAAAGLYISFNLSIQSTYIVPALTLLGFVYPGIWLHEVVQKREKKLFKELPFFLDAITLAVESGSSLTGALNHAAMKAPPGPMSYEFSRILRDVRAGIPRAVAMRNFADRVDINGVTSFVSSVIQAEKTGANLGPVLRAQADQRRKERFIKAEKSAMEAPVKMLGPLIMFIFPNTFAVLGFLILTKAIMSDVLPDPLQASLEWALYWPSSPR